MNLAKSWFCLNFSLSFPWFNICYSMHESNIWNGFMLNLVLLVYVCMIQYVPNKITRKSTHRCITWLTCITHITYITFITCLTGITCITWITCIAWITNISCITRITWNTCITRIACIMFITWITFITCVLLVYHVSLILLDLLNIWRRKKVTDPRTTSNQEMLAHLKIGLGKKLKYVNVCSIPYVQHRNILCLWIMIEFERSVRGAKPRIKYNLIQMH